jgi:S1-C subfamily serine protease/Flp pilus assembly protein TadD
MQLLILGVLVSWPELPIARDSHAVAGTVWIRAGDRAVGAGWVVDVKQRWILTARHVVADRERVEIFFHDHVDGRPITQRDHYLAKRDELRKRGRLTTGHVVKSREGADLALVRVDALPKDAVALRLATRLARFGDPCFLIGHRHDAELLWNRTDGHVRQLGKLSDGYFWAGKKLSAKVPVLLIQAPIELGESGTALLNQSGHVIGLVSAVSNRTPGLGIAIDLAEIRGLLAEARQDNRVVTDTSGVEKRADVAALRTSSVWVRPKATEGRAAGVLIDRKRGLILTTASAVGGDDVVDVVAPKRDRDRIVAEATEYRDLLGLRLTGHCVQGVVLARDSIRDLALIELDRVPDGLDSIPLAASAKMGDRVSALSHPTAEELLWLFAAGSVRSVGRVTLRRDGADQSTQVTASLLQLPHQGSASGGPVVNERGELVGVLASREGARQELAYAATPNEIREMLKSARPLCKPESAAEWHARALYLEHRGRGVAALAAHAEAAALAPKDSLILAARARALAEGGQADSARKAIEHVAALMERHPEADAELARAYAALAQRDKAVDLVQSALKRNSKLADALVTRAGLTSGRDALGDLEEALFLDPKCARAYRLRAERHDPKDPGYRQKALADLNRAIELSPYETAARTRRAGLFLQTKEFKKAVADMNRLTELQPMHVDHWLGLADAQFLAGDRSASARSLAAVMRCDRSRMSEVFKSIQGNARRLEEDNSADIQRIAEWYATGLTEALPWLPDANRRVVEKAMSEAGMETDDA